MFGLIYRSLTFLHPTAHPLQQGRHEFSKLERNRKAEFEELEIPLVLGLLLPNWEVAAGVFNAPAGFVV